MTQVLNAPPRRRPPVRHRRPGPPRFGVILIVLAVLAAGVLVWRSGVFGPSGAHPSAVRSPASTRPSARASSRTSVSPTTNPTSPALASEPTPGPINTAFPGLTTFRGNATRDYYGEGPLPTHPVVLWRYPTTGGLCSSSNSLGVTKVWCGTGWTGQPNVIQHANGTIEIREGAYDDHYHFLNGLTGKPMRPDLVTGDLAKGSATTDADGWPLYYAGSRDNYLRVVALDRSKPTVLWKYNSRSNPHLVWNDDWDGAPLQVGDCLLEGGENSWFYVIRLNRHWGPGHRVAVDPTIVMQVPGYDQQLFRDIKDKDVSIENSVAFDASSGVVYFANSGGLVQGWNISDILKGGTRYERVFRFWNGDDTDASIVIGPDGDLYVGRKMEENVKRPSSFPRDHQVGSLMKLDPRKPNHPVVWSVQLGGFEPDGGVLGTPAYYKGIVYSTFTEGGFVAVDSATGKLLWTVKLPGPTWNSPVPIDDKLLVGDCSGYLHAFDVSNPRHAPKQLWSLKLGGCIESTPAVWHGMIWVGTRDGGIYGIGDRKA